MDKLYEQMKTIKELNFKNLCGIYIIWYLFMDWNILGQQDNKSKINKLSNNQNKTSL